MKRKDALGRYRKVYVRIWGDEKFRRLTPAPPNAQTLWFRLLFPKEATNIPGLLAITENSLADSLGWSLKAFRKSFAEISDLRMAKADWRSGVVWIPNGIQYHQPESPNVVRSWVHPWNEVPECRLKWQAYVILEQSVMEIDANSKKPEEKAFTKAFTEALQPPFPEVLDRARREAFEVVLTQPVLEGIGQSEAEAEAEAELSLRSGPSLRKASGKPSASPPAEMPITPALEEWAQEEGITVNLGRETAKMLDHFRANGETKVDWEATRRNWLRNSQTGKYGKPNGATPSVPADRQKEWGGSEFTPSQT